MKRETVSEKGLDWPFPSPQNVYQVEPVMLPAGVIAWRLTEYHFPACHILPHSDILVLTPKAQGLSEQGEVHRRKLEGSCFFW